MLWNNLNEYEYEAFSYAMGYAVAEIGLDVLLGQASIKISSSISTKLPKIKSKMLKAVGTTSKALENSADDIIDLVVKNADEIAEVVAKHGDDAIEVIGKYGDDIPEIIGKYGDDAIEIIEKYGDDAVEIAGGIKKTFASFLQDAKKFPDISDDLVEHIFKGQINANGSAVGFHYEGISDSLGSVTKILEAPNAQGVYKAEVMVNGISKKFSSTFFPKGWTPKQVLEAIEEAYKSRVIVEGRELLYEGMSKAGVVIRMYIENGIITSAYPIM